MIESGEIKVLIVEDNLGDAVLVEEYLKISDIGIRSIHIAGDLESAAKIISTINISVALLDLNLVHTSGLETFELFVKIAPKIPVVVLSGSEDEEIALETMKRGAQDYLVKGRKCFVEERNLISGNDWQIRRVFMTELFWFRRISQAIQGTDSYMRNDQIGRLGLCAGSRTVPFYFKKHDYQNCPHLVN